ncbi:DUF2835 family protein [Aliiglaciecola sp. LCG003]|uniref:DUF2835 family protein n=1 Tax=Aliiglaciecola sp. LCG003 TaxID=3053655 RepID=UPI0025735FF0|nr:DUF2835 family protein [Aliiglaciecola sp. LCG003]WJG07655.1 DUF2835 family protein [Aliiglaciecola sp. LCG003]
MKTYYFNLSASYDKCEKLYLAGSNAVVLVAENGERVQLPTVNLRPFVTRLGLIGRFRLIITAENKVHSFEKIS